MKFLYFELSNTVRWRVHRDDPPILPVECLPGWVGVNPLIYPDLFSLPPDQPSVYAINGLHEGDALVRTGLLVLAQPADVGTPPPSFENALALLRKWRHVSRQALLTASLLSIASRAGPLEVDPVPLVPFPDPATGLPASITRKAVDCALTLEHLRLAANLGTEFVVPIHDALLLDAICACFGGDYRKAILYAAIAVETLANSKLEDALEAAAASTSPATRFVSVPGKTAPTRKDPVYEALCQGTNFGRLLHERPLYLLNRSLFVEDQALYSQALRLYTTRNKIAHRGEPSTEHTEALPLDRAGALLALECAIRVFRWYGEGQGYHLPSHDHVDGIMVPPRRRHPTDHNEVYLGTAIINIETVEVMAALPEPPEHALPTP